MMERTNLEKHDEILIHPDGNFLLVVDLCALDLFPLVLVSCFLSALDVQLGDFIDEAFHAGIAAYDLASLELVPADAESSVGTIKERLHDRGVFARVDAGHLDVVCEEGEVLERDRLVFVVADNVVHHVLRGEGLPVGQIPGEVESRGAVVRRVHDVEGVCAPSTIQNQDEYIQLGK